MDFSDSMYSIIRQAFPWATIVIDCFHIMQLCGDGLGELRMKLKRAAVAELKRQEREFKNRLARNQKQRKNYRKKHPKKYKGKVRGARSEAHAQEHTLHPAKDRARGQWEDGL